jgi:outer membrane protein assembly factor BamE (lipoprotein component of BamABCDE complex)
MRPRPLVRAGVALSLGAFLVASCAPTVRVHGYVPSQAEVARIRPGVDTAATVEEVWGRPSSSGVISDSAWYYVQSTIENFTYNPPRVVDRTVLAVNFNSAGVVEDVARYGLEDGRIVDLTARTTDTGGRQLGVLEQLFGNLLNIDAEAFEQ